MPSSPARERAALNSSSVLHQRRSVLLGMAGASLTRQPVEDCSMRYKRFLTSLESSEEPVRVFFMVLSPQCSSARTEQALFGVGRRLWRTPAWNISLQWPFVGSTQQRQVLLQANNLLGVSLDRTGIGPAAGRNPPRERRMITHPGSPSWGTGCPVGDADLIIVQGGGKVVRPAGDDAGQLSNRQGGDFVVWKGLKEKDGE